MAEVESHHDRSPLHLRLIAGLFGSALLALLILAGTLRPDSSGHGTHQQLGLPPCVFIRIYGVRCPSCGMTTSWSRLMRGQVIGALGANVGGVLLALISATAGPWLLIFAIRGRPLGGLPSDLHLALGSLLVTVTTLLDWSVRLLTR